MARKLTRKEKRRRNKALFRLQQRKRNLKRACVGKARTKAGRRRKARSWKCRYHKAQLPKNKRAVKKAYRRKGRKPVRRVRGRTKARRNPATVDRALRGGGSISIHNQGDRSVFMAYGRSGELLIDMRMPYAKAVRLARGFRNTAELEEWADEQAWATLSRDNPRRRGRKSTRRNCGVMRNAPIKRGDLSALRRIIASHTKKRRKKARR